MPFPFKDTEAPANVTVVGSTVVASKVAVPRIATGTVRSEPRSMLLG